MTNDKVTLRYLSRTTGASGRVKSDGKILKFDSREDAERYCLKHSTSMTSYYIDEE